MNFRFKALAKLREPDELDSPTVLTSPRGWVTLGCLAAVTLAALGWGVLGRVPQTVSASGLITRPGGAVQVQSLFAGMVSGLSIGIGGQVTPGQTLAVVRDAQGASHKVVSLFAGDVVGLQVAAGEVISAGTPVATIERSAPGGSQLVAMLFVPPSQAAGITPGQTVGLAVASAPSPVFGLLRGQVLSVSQLPLTAAVDNSLLGGVIPVATLTAGGGKRLVTVRLRQDARTASGYSWTTAHGPPAALPPLVPATGTITLGAQAPISLLFSR